MKKIIALLSLFLSSCSTVAVYDYGYSPKKADEVQVYSSTRPDCTYKEIAKIYDDGCWLGINRAILWGKKKAAEIGGDFIVIRDHCGQRFDATVFVCQEKGKKSEKIFIEK